MIPGLLVNISTLKEGAVNQFHLTYENKDLNQEITFVASKFNNNNIEGIVYEVHDNFQLTKEFENYGKVNSALDVFNGLEAAVSIINEQGLIIWTNDKWVRFAIENNGDLNKTTIGSNYLTTCENTEGIGSSEAKKTARAIKKIFSSNLNSFQQKYPIQSENGTNYYMVILNKVVINNQSYILLIHEDITETVLLTEKEKKATLIAEQKDELIKEIHHRVKNNLQIVKSLISLQINRITDEQIKEILNTTSRRISTISLLHEKLYSDDNINKVNLKEYLTDLSNLIIQTSDILIQIDIQIDVIFMDSSEANLLGMIISELISNSIKYGFNYSDNNLITLTLKKQKEQIELNYQDNGNGFDLSSHKKGLGSRLIENLSAQLKAKSTLKSSPGNGIEFSLTINNY